MRVVLQRVSQASVTVEGKMISQINQGYLILLGIGQQDNEEKVKWLADKIVKLRIMADNKNKMNRSILDNQGAILVVSQFTLYANTNEGRRPSFTQAAEPTKAKKLYELFIQELKKMSKPGQILYLKSKDLPRLLKERGIIILSTSSGLMTIKEAAKKKIGGEALARIW